MTPEDRFTWLRDWFSETALLQSAADTLEWDERTGLPPAAGDYRASQITLLRGLIHQRCTDPRVGDHLEVLQDSLLAEDPRSDAGVSIRKLAEDYRRACRLPQKLVEALARATVTGQQTWEAARAADDFSRFAPALTEILQLQRETAGHLQEPGQTAYDALLAEYEPGVRAAELQPIFAELQAALVPLVQALQQAPHQPDRTLLRRHFPIEAQRRFSRFAAETVGFDFQRGRLDVTSHPFCTQLGPDDSRILTRYDENYFPTGLFGTLHEAGHGMYDQGLRRQWFGLPPGSFASLGIHESQSRLWENLVGRSAAFWQFLFPHAQTAFPAALGDVREAEVHFAVNAVQPSLIRVEADEATYNLHIIIRFELECALIAGELTVSDLPGAWNEKYEKRLGITPPSAAEGVLQDVHWSAGLFGYFPTYTLGNLCAAQLYAAASKSLGDLDGSLRRGDCRALLDWLRRNIHQHGRRFSAGELIQQATGAPLSATALMESLQNRYQPLYQL